MTLDILFSWPAMMYMIGVLTRALLPWLIKIIVQLRSESDEPVKWQWRYLGGQLLTALVVLLISPLLVDDILVILDASPFAAWAIGYSVAAIGRELDKLLGAFSTER